MGQVIRVDADTVSTDESRSEGQEIPFGAGGLQDLECVDAQTVENQRQFIDQGNIQVALGVLDDLVGLGDLDATVPAVMMLL